MQITADSIGVYTKVFSLSPYQNFDVIRQWSVQGCLMSGPSCLLVIQVRRVPSTVRDFLSEAFLGNRMPYLDDICYVGGARAEVAHAEFWAWHMQKIVRSISRKPYAPPGWYLVWG